MTNNPHSRPNPYLDNFFWFDGKKQDLTPIYKSKKQDLTPI